jgi:hypothetical protein
MSHTTPFSAGRSHARHGEFMESCAMKRTEALRSHGASNQCGGVVIAKTSQPKGSSSGGREVPVRRPSGNRQFAPWAVPVMGTDATDNAAPRGNGFSADS